MSHPEADQPTRVIAASLPQDIALATSCARTMARGLPIRERDAPFAGMGIQ